MALSNINKPKLLSLVALMFHLMMLYSEKVQSQGDTTYFSFDSFASDPTNLIYQGDAHVPSGSRYLRLIRPNTAQRRPQNGRVGRVLYSPPVKFWESGRRQASFETNMVFDFSAYRADPGDAITFFIAPLGSTIPSGSAGGNLGIFDSSGTSSSLFAVEFDIYPNAWDPSNAHIGIDINSRLSTSVAELGRGYLDYTVTARISYDATTRRISVVAYYFPQTKFTLSYVFDLKTILPQLVQVGISGSTGNSLAYHDIWSWNFNSTLVREN